MNIILLSFIALNFSLTSAMAVEKKCEKTITFLPQTHVHILKKISEAEKKNINSIAKTQLEIAQFIMNKKEEVPVFIEGLSQNLKMPKGQRSPEAREWGFVLDKVFEEKKSVENMSEKEKETLANATGAMSALILNKIEVLRKTIPDKSVENKMDADVEEYWQSHKDIKTNDEKAMDLFFRNREKLALTQIISYFNNNPEKNEAILVFGGRHNFPKYAEQIPGLCFVIPEEFKAEFKSSTYSVNTNDLVTLKLKESAPAVTNSPDNKAGAQ